MHACGLDSTECLRRRQLGPVTDPVLAVAEPVGEERVLLVDHTGHGHRGRLGTPAHPLDAEHQLLESLPPEPSIAVDHQRLMPRTARSTASSISEGGVVCAGGAPSGCSHSPRSHEPPNDSASCNRRAWRNSNPSS